MPMTIDDKRECLDRCLSTMNKARPHGVDLARKMGSDDFKELVDLLAETIASDDAEEELKDLMRREMFMQIFACMAISRMFECLAETLRLEIEDELNGRKA